MSAQIDINDFDENNNHKISIEIAFKFLKEGGYIFAGSIIPGNIIESALNKKNEDTWKFLGPWLELKSRIEEENFFTTTAGIEAPGIRILSTLEMADHAYKKIKKNTSSNTKVADIMLCHDIGKLDETNQKKHNFIQRKAAEMALFNQKILFKRVFI